MPADLLFEPSRDIGGETRVVLSGADSMNQSNGESTDPVLPQLSGISMSALNVRGGYNWE
jgi:hypothetical protein